MGWLVTCRLVARRIADALVVALIAASLGLCARLLCSWLTQDPAHPYAVFYVVATIIAAWYAGLHAGILCTVLSCCLLLLVPTDGFALSDADSQRIFAGVVIIGVLASLLFENVHASQRVFARMQSRYENAVEAVNGIVYEGDLRNGSVECSAQMLSVLGFAPNETPGTIDWWMSRIHPDDRPIVDKNFNAALANDLNKIRTQYRILHRDGHWVDVEDCSVLIRDAAGQPIGLIGCTVDISIQKRIEQELRDSSQNKDHFLATLAHELRNPLAPVFHSLGVLEAEATEGVGREKAIQVIWRQAKQIERLVNELLDVGRIASNKILIDAQQVDLVEVVRQAIETTTPLIEANGHALSVDLPKGSIWVHGDQARLVQVFVNLLTNSAKYTDRDGALAVILSVDENSETVMVKVTDNGIGIEANKLPSIFELFSQATEDQRRARGGLGIGLNLVKKIIDLHGGQVEVRSEGLGKGTTVLVRLPEAKRDERSSATIERTNGRASSQKVLVVDDNHDSCESVAFLLEPFCGLIRTAYDGEKALSLAKEMQPHVIILDLSMPACNGFELCQAIRAEAWGRNALIIAQTGWASDEHRERSMRAGFDLHLVKPVSPDC